jgi:hypothetical protein
MYCLEGNLAEISWGGEEVEGDEEDIVLELFG